MKMICRMSPSTNGPTTLSGTRWVMNSHHCLVSPVVISFCRRFAGLDRGGVGVDAVTDAEDVDRHQPEEHREDGADLEVGQRLDPGHADLLQIGDTGDAADDGQEDDRPDQHLHRGDEGGADRLHRDPRGWAEPSEEDADDDR